MADDNQWYLLKAQNEELLGPVGMDELREWAASAKISPLDKLSNDGQRSWTRAPMVRELQMDWLIEVSTDFLYGPTTIGTIAEFYRNGEVDIDTTVIRCSNGEKLRIAELPTITATGVTAAIPVSLLPGQKSSSSPSQTPGGLHQEKIFHLEKQLLDTQRALRNTDQRLKTLRRHYFQATGQEPPV